jgi:hypothetical protein
VRHSFAWVKTPADQPFVWLLRSRRRAVYFISTAMFMLGNVSAWIGWLGISTGLFGLKQAICCSCLPPSIASLNSRLKSSLLRHFAGEPSGSGFGDICVIPFGPYQKVAWNVLVRRC